MTATSSLQRLGLADGADERAVKRAYARELKQIDQEHDAAGFQVLRDAYERALEWVRQQPTLEAAPVDFAPPSPVPVAYSPGVTKAPEPAQRQRAATPVARAPARDADTGERPAQLAQSVFDDFQAAAAQLVANGQTRDGVAWRRVLQACLDDQRLLNIAARAHFEFYIARLLADGWKRGHESLFVAARQVFGWEKDRRRLGEFGQLGAWLNQAIDECEMFNHQEVGERDGQVDALLRVREPLEPDERDLTVHTHHLGNMAARFPAWTAIIASTERIGQWIELEAALPKKRRRRKYKWATATSKESSDFNWWGLIFFVLVATSMLWRAGSSPEAPSGSPFDPPRLAQPVENISRQTPEQQAAEDAYRRAAGALYMDPDTRTLDRSPYAAQQATLPPPAPRKPAGRPPNAAERKAIGERIQFEWTHVEPRMYTVDIMVELDEQGRIKQLTKKRASGLPVLDRHVEEAIRESAPFKPEISRSFGLTYSWGRMPGKKRAPKDDAPPAGESQGVPQGAPQSGPPAPTGA